MSHDFLTDRVALIMGGGHGIGAATARALAGFGARLSLAARSAQDIETVTASILQNGGEAIGCVADIADEGAVDSVVGATLKQFGRIDFVLNFAASTGTLGRPLWQISTEECRHTHSVNVTGPMNLARSTIPIMIEQASGLLAFVSSPLGDRPVRGMGAYGSSRAAVNYLSMQLATELHGTGVASCLVYPAITETPGLEAFRAAFAPGGPIGGNPGGYGRVESPETMASMFAWLCRLSSAEANGYVFAWRDESLRRAVHEFQQSVSSAGC